jgi:hypothetical protein
MGWREGPTWVLWICALSLVALWRPALADPATASGVQAAQRELGNLEAARDAAGSAERGKVDPLPPGDSGTVLEAHKRLIDFELKQQKTLVARETELQEVRGEIASLKADVEKLKTAAKQRDGELTERRKERESLEAKSRDELASMRSQLGKLEASLAEERKERERAENEVKHLEAEREKLRAQLEQPQSAPKQESAPEQAGQEEPAISQPTASEAVGPGIKKWQKPDGTLFFGERAPPGSKLLGAVENLGTSGGGDGQVEASPQQ